MHTNNSFKKIGYLLYILGSSGFPFPSELIIKSPIEVNIKVEIELHAVFIPLNNPFLFG